jgi:hypothetical protein
MIFITFSILDYLCQIGIAVLDFLNLFKGHDNYFYELPEESHYITLGIAGLSALFLIFVFPVWVIQILNCVKSPPRRAESRTMVRHMSGSFGELSDTGSMLLKPSSEWNLTSFNNQNEASFLVPRERAESGGCCYSKRNEDSMGVSLGKRVK